MKKITLKVPLKEDEIRALNIGDIVFFDGLFYTCRTLFQIRAIKQNIVPPIDFKKINLMVHMGPVMKKEDDTWHAVSLDPTSSIRFEKFGPAIIPKLNIRAIIGKTTMGSDTSKAMKKFGCVHLTKVGVCGNILASKITKVLEVYNLKELGNTEATWVMEAKNFGPFIVDMDTKGQNYFLLVNNQVKNNLKKQ